MPFINKDSQVVINSKLTSVGRQLLASGRLNFSKFAIGDSEINYKFLAEGGLRPEDNMVLRPLDQQPNIKHFLNPFSGSNTVMGSVNVPLALPTSVVNQVPNVGLFSGDSTNGFTLKTDSLSVSDKYLVSKASITGGNTITLTTVPAVEIGEYVLVAWKGVNAATNNNALGVFESAKPTQYLWYKIVAVSGSTLTLDKKVPNFGGSAAVGDNHLYVFPKGDSVRHFYSSPVASTAQTNVWNFTIVYSESIEGSHGELTAEGYPSRAYVGLKSYLGSIDPKAVGVIHYSNYSKYSPYGEGFNGATFKVELPSIMYHRNGAGRLGATLQASGDQKMVNANLYYDLVDGSSKVVGKVFNQLKLAIIEDQEILAAMSLKSNRNWTLPEMSDVYANIEEAESDFYFTYLFETGDGAYEATSSLGFNTSLHCQYIHKIEASKLRHVEFTFKPGHLGFFRDASNMGNTSHTGFNARRMKILMQRVPKGTKPSHHTWVAYDYTPDMVNYGAWSTQTIPLASLTATHRITETMYTSALANAQANGYYNLNYLEANMPVGYFQLNTASTEIGNAYPGFTFGEESVLLGNVSVDAKAEVFKSNFILTLNPGVYNVSLNPTWVPGQNTYISEVGIYDDDANLVVIGKLSHPVEKVPNSIITITLDIDF